MFLYRELASLIRLRPTLRTQLTLLYAGLLAALGGGLLFLLVPLRGSASVEAGPHSAAVSAALNTSIRQKEITGAIALPVVVLLALVGGWLIAGRFPAAVAHDHRDRPGHLRQQPEPAPVAEPPRRRVRQAR